MRDRDQVRKQMQCAGVWRHAVVVCFTALLLCAPSAVQAASLGKIEVASPIGKPLYAEVPLQLKSNELASKVFIEIASAGDYKIFEVYRDPVLNNIRADVASDERGVRVKLTSRIAMQSPFFNLVLKIRYGRVSHFKKYAVFIDAAKSIQRIAEQPAVPEVKAIAPVKSLATGTGLVQAGSAQTGPAQTEAIQTKPARTATAGKALISQQDMQAAEAQLKAQQTQPAVYQGWARTEKYGPIVRGDTLSVVARRLRIDQRYSTSQIMVALFEKNKKSFNKSNLNLIKANSFLQIPSAAEVEKYNKSEAFRITREHRQAWKQQPRYAVEAEEQRRRYSPRVSIGKQADAQVDVKTNHHLAVAQLAAVKPVPATQDLLKPEHATPPAAVAKVGAETVQAAGNNVTAQLIVPELKTLMQRQAETNQLLAALQQKNEQLQQQLIANKDSVDALNEKVDEGATAASNARMEKLELLLTRLQAELEKQTQKSPTIKTEALDWVTWLLLSLLIVMLGVIAMLMRKEPAHPASVEQKAALDTSTQQSQVIAESDSAMGHLEEAVEQEVDAIEIDEQEVSLAKATGTFDAMAAFTDELSDTDTAELEPFDVDAKQELDPNVDYLSEADVYIRYGMDDEALQQLDMALRLNPEHAEAHIKKAEVLHGKQDKQAFAAAVAAATAILGATGLAQYQAAVEAFGGDVDVRPDESELPMVEGVDTVAPVTLAIDDAEIDALDFDLADLNMDVEDPEAAIGKATDIETNTSSSNTDKTEDFAVSEELDWLSDPAFEAQIETGLDGSASDQVVDDQSEIETIALASNSLDTDNRTDDSGLLSMGAATQQLDSLLGEFPDDEQTIEEPVAFVTTDDQSDVELHGLLSEFTEQDDVDGGLSHLDETAATQNSVEDTFEAGATQHLDKLLNEFSDDDDLSFAGSADDFDPAVIDQARASADTDSTATGSMDVATTHVDANYGATQELDSLLAEFSDDDDDGLSFIASTDDSAALKDAADLDHGATQELNTLLGEFSGADQTSEIDQGATQVLGHLLDEFSDDDEDDKKKS
ncbi:MAG: FimV/HubP family polar landmark protein [Mariprofundus sp.]|nr:FimV/HubP family polar landmark protein [Mariprofundus sp.]